MKSAVFVVLTAAGMFFISPRHFPVSTQISEAGVSCPAFSPSASTGCPYLDALREGRSTTGCPYLDRSFVGREAGSCPYLNRHLGPGAKDPAGARGQSDTKSVLPNYRLPATPPSRQAPKTI